MSAAVHAALMDRVRSLLRCPGCSAGIPWTAGPSLACPGCRASYPVLAGGVPQLVVPARRKEFQAALEEDSGGRGMVEHYRRYGTWRGRVRRFLKPPSIVYDRDLARRHAWIYDTRGADTLVLSIGGGPGRENPRVINLNLDAFDSVDLVADGTNIPLVDGSIDTVTANAIVEHLPNPAVLVAEIDRVLKPGGYCQLMVPFLFPFHAYPSDYQRYSREGVLELTRSLEVVELAVLTGPASALNVILRDYVRLLVPGGNGPLLRPLLNGITGWLTFPFKYVDLLLNRRPEASHLAAAFYYLGRKPARTP
jgi:SAM-dependent methyltransferase